MKIHQRPNVAVRVLPPRMQARRAAVRDGGSAETNAAARVAGSGGVPLSHEARSYFEPRFGCDFSHVRIHADAEAASAAHGIHAQAYALGRDIVFADGMFKPDTAAGRHLLAHELTHVVQQSFGQDKVIRRHPDKDESEQRAALLTAFTDGADLPAKRVAQIGSAMRAFSLHQLDAMRKAGVRFWPPGSLPPEFAGRVKAKDLTTPGGYLDTLHIIRMADKASTDAIRHELAHAWDHVRTGKVKPIGKLKGDAFQKALEHTPELSSATGEKRSTKEEHAGSMRSARLTVAEMLQRYKRWKLREQSFDNPSTKEGYSKTSTREFYAEGYSVFHGGSEWNQAKLLYYAPELYELLEAESKEEGLAVPDRAALAQAIRDQRLPP